MDLMRSSKISTIVILITITLVATVTSSWATDTEAPGDLGGMGTINGKERPDLIEHFDFLRQKKLYRGYKPNWHKFRHHRFLPLLHLRPH
jgi:hypothetical protein